jgi:hypothetical protein
MYSDSVFIRYESFIHLIKIKKRTTEKNHFLSKNQIIEIELLKKLIFKGKVVENGSTKLFDLGIETSYKILLTRSLKRHLLQRKDMVALKKKYNLKKKLFREAHQRMHSQNQKNYC